jgi:hypothetical protein
MAAHDTTWDDYWGSIHEAAHAVVARHLGYDVTLLTMTVARVRHRRDYRPDGAHSKNTWSFPRRATRRPRCY